MGKLKKKNNRNYKNRKTKTYKYFQARRQYLQLDLDVSRAARVCCCYGRTCYPISLAEAHPPSPGSISLPVKEPKR